MNEHTGTSHPHPEGSRPTPRRAFRFNRQELSGSLGDLGTFLPLLVGMSVTSGLDFTSALLFAGAFNIVSGLVFAIPLAVQPMKAIAAIAIDQSLPVEQILAAGICTSAVILLLGVTRLIEWFNRIIPLPVVRGIQLGVGLVLIGKGIDLIRGAPAWWGWDGMAIGMAGLALTLVFFRTRSVPTALILFGAGLCAAVLDNPDAAAELTLGLNLPRFVTLSFDDFHHGFVNMAVAQIPLTTLNSVIAVCALSADLFPDRPATPRAVATSVGLMNLIGCWFGAMPMCHGAGGLAAQYRFGARTSISILLLGAAKVALALAFGGSLLTLVQVYPLPILGVLLGLGGLELAVAARDQTEREPAMVMLATAGATLALRSTAIGFAVGWLFALLLAYAGRIQASADSSGDDSKSQKS